MGRKPPLSESPMLRLRVSLTSLLSFKHQVDTVGNAQALFSSKEGAPQVRLKVGLVSDDAGHNFTFTSPQPGALAEREKFKSELTNIISRNRSGVGTPAQTPGTPATPVPANASKARLPQSASKLAHSRGTSADPRASGTPIGHDPTNDYRLRKKVLLSNPDLAALHRELVMGGHISENEFWEGREVTHERLLDICGHI